MKRGFSLAEVLITLALFALTLGVIATMLRRVHQASEQSSHRQKALAGMGVALQQLRSELFEAVWVQPPAAGQPIFFHKVNPGAEALRLPRPLPSPLPDLWDAVRPDYLLAVRYELADSRLLRNSYPLDRPDQMQRSLVAEGVGGLTLSPGSRPGEWKILMTVREGGRILEFTSAICSYVYASP